MTLGRVIFHYLFSLITETLSKLGADIFQARGWPERGGASTVLA